MQIEIPVQIILGSYRKDWAMHIMCDKKKTDNNFDFHFFSVTVVMFDKE